MTSGDFAIGLSTIITGLAITVMLAKSHCGTASTASAVTAA